MLCLPGLTFKGVTLSIYVEVKSLRTENNNYLAGGLKEPVNKGFWHQEVYNNPSSFSKQEA